MNLLNRHGADKLPAEARAQMEQIAGADKVLDLFRKNPKLANPRKLEQVARSASIARKLALGIPIVAEFAVEAVKFVGGEIDERRRYRAATERDKHLAQLVDEVVRAELGRDEAEPTGWSAVIAQLRKAIRAHVPPADEQRADEDRRTELVAAARSLALLLREAPAVA